MLKISCKVAEAKANSKRGRQKVFFAIAMRNVERLQLKLQAPPQLQNRQ
jgi:hypothetical protein